MITHGTDTMTDTAAALTGLSGKTIVLTGALRPYMLRNSDAEQNLTEALLAVQVLEPGIYCVMHNKVLRFPGVIKDHERSTFRYADDESA